MNYTATGQAYIDWYIVAGTIGSFLDRLYKNPQQQPTAQEHPETVSYTLLPRLDQSNGTRAARDWTGSFPTTSDTLTTTADFTAQTEDESPHTIEPPMSSAMPFVPTPVSAAVTHQESDERLYVTPGLDLPSSNPSMASTGLSTPTPYDLELFDVIPRLSGNGKALMPPLDSTTFTGSGASLRDPTMRLPTFSSLPSSTMGSMDVTSANLYQPSERGKGKRRMIDPSSDIDRHITSPDSFAFPLGCSISAPSGLLDFPLLDIPPGDSDQSLGFEDDPWFAETALQLLTPDDELYVRALEFATARNKRQRSPSLDTSDLRSRKKAKMTTDDDDNLEPHGHEDTVRWTTPVVQPNKQLEQGAFAYEDVPPQRDVPRFLPAAEAGPAEGSSTSGKERVPCPIPSCSMTFACQRTAWRHVATNRNHSGVRSEPGWEVRYGIPLNTQRLRIRCPYIGCERHNRKRGLRSDEMNNHMRDVHRVGVETWKKRVATLIRRRQLAGTWTAEDEVSTEWEYEAEVTNFQELSSDVVDKDLVAWSGKYVWIV
ncbi:uncharacterized protein STEHIDRAFT_159288 [Stereum hirsutum FP-91666 SS1]|uniref:uncharacterized protein n=1 Tax=Stereum hirsutum (strain FP-91666) TaxID=721885 RepID=UPI000444A134|nr:uncharacterized protein STEHIDRAFT_159288 [Stereum hirsutum FP-91666 SS1]EIM84624.1 hypothetical protein STEHIDRAFT_159288 [Stereum hirsutum FP-91666 SS1]